MSGHSKWSTIKHKKAVKDARRGKLFNKLIKDLTISAAWAAAMWSANPRCERPWPRPRRPVCRTTRLSGRSKKAPGELEGVSYEEVVYEGHGPGGGRSCCKS